MKSRTFSSLKLADWSPLDRQLWLDCRAPGDFWDDAGLAAAWRPATIVNVECHYGTFLWWLQTMGRLDPDASPFERASVANVRDFIDAYRVDHAGSSVAAIVGVIGDFVKVTCPEAEAPWIKAMAHRLKRRAKPVKPIAQRKRPAVDLLQLGEALMERGRAIISDDPVVGAVAFRDGLMIVAETNLPLRSRNFAGLQLGVTLLRGETTYRMQFPGAQMKNGQDFDGSYPECLTPDLDFYVDHVRPRLRARRSDQDQGWFWLGRWGAPMAGDSISLRVSRHLRQHFGVPLTLHSFRHSVATDIALLDPKHVGITKSVLGHASPLTAKYYNLASGFEAAATYQTVLEDLRFKDRQQDRQKSSQNDAGG